MRVILRGATVMPLDGRHVLKRSDVLVDDGVIAAAGGTLDTQDAHIVDVEGVLMPGLVDAHAHLDQALLDRHFVPHLDPNVYHQVQVAAWRAGLDADAVGIMATTALGRGLLSGTTAVGDASASPNGSSAVEAALRLGARLCLAVDGARGDPSSALAVLSERAALEPRATISAAVWGGDAERTARRHLAAAADAARQARVPLVVHAGTLPHDRIALRRLERAGALDARLVVCHAGGRTLDDPNAARRLAEAGATVVLTPGADILSGAPPPALGPLLEHDVNLALGAESGATRMGFDLFREVRLLRRLLVGRADRPASRALAIAARGGGRALGLPVGSIEVGHRADLVLLDVEWEEGEGHEEVARRIVDHGGPDLVKSVWVDGRSVVHNGRLLNGALPTEEAEEHVRARSSHDVERHERSVAGRRKSLLDWLGRRHRRRLGWHAGRLPFGR